MKIPDFRPFISGLGAMVHDGFLELIIERLQWIFTSNISQINRKANSIQLFKEAG